MCEIRLHRKLSHPSSSVSSGRCWTPTQSRMGKKKKKDPKQKIIDKQAVVIADLRKKLLEYVEVANEQAQRIIELQR